MLANLSTAHIETLTDKLTFQLAPAVPQCNCRARDSSARHLKASIDEKLENSKKLHTRLQQNTSISLQTL